MSKSARGDSRFVFLAAAVLLLAAGFRLFALQEFPPGLSQDEVLNAGMPAYILDGNFEIFFSQAYGHEPLYHYLTIFTYWLFGENYLEVRLVSAFVGLLLVAVTMRWARRDFGTVTAVVAGLVLAISWVTVIFSRVGIRPIMQPLFWVAAAWFWHKRPWLAGLFLGLSLYTYTGAQVSFAIPILYAIIQTIIGQDRAIRSRAIKISGIALGTTLLVGAPLYISWLVDPAQLQRVDQVSGPIQALGQGNVVPIAKAVLRTLAVFSFSGDPRWTYSLPGRPLFDPLTALLFYAGLIMALWRIRRPRYTLLVSLLLAGLLPSMLTAQSPSTIRLLGALPAAYVLMGLPVSWLAHERSWAKSRWRPAVVIGLAMLLLLNIGRTIQTSVTWANALETRLDHYQTAFLEIGRHLRAQPTQDAVVADSFVEQIDVESLQRNMGEHYQVRWVQAGSGVAGAIVFPGGSGAGRLYVPEYAPINPGLLRETGLSDEPAYRSSTRPSFAVYSLPDRLPEPASPTAVTYDGRIRLEGHSAPALDKEGNLSFYTYWRVLQPLPWNLTAFVHAIDSQGNLLGQFDGLDSVPGQLMPGDFFVQTHRLAISPDAGPFDIRLGLYTPDSGDRLPIDGQSLDYYVLEAGFRSDAD